MPKNTSAGLFIGALSFVLGFAMVWHLFYLAALAAVGILAVIIKRLYVKETDYYVTAEEVKEIESREQKL